jgi:replicative DNA helicase
VLLLERDKLDLVLEILPSPDAFYSPAHRAIYAAMQAMSIGGQVVDILTVTQTLLAQQALDAVGGAYYLTQLTQQVVSGAHVEAHARIVQEHYIRRQVISTAGSMIARAYDTGLDALELLADAEAELLSLAQDGVKRDAQHISRLARDFADMLDEKRRTKATTIGIPTGFTEVDAVTGGWKIRGLNIIGARPAVGKTALVLNSLYHAATQGYPCALFSLEMSAPELVQRLAAHHSRIPGADIRMPHRISPDGYQRITHSLSRLSTLPLYIDDSAVLGCAELRARVRRLRRKYGIRMVAIDYLQLMKGDVGNSKYREQEIAQISRLLKTLAKDEDIAVLALSQLNRQAAGHKPRLSDLRESGAIEQDADIVALLYRPTKEEEATDPQIRGCGYFDIAKHRDGDTAEIILRFDPSTQTWSDGVW